MSDQRALPRFSRSLLINNEDRQGQGGGERFHSDPKVLSFMTLPWELRNIIQRLLALHSDQITALRNIVTASNTLQKSAITILSAAEDVLLPYYNRDKLCYGLPSRETVTSDGIFYK
jgi:hypothetical protein